MLPANIKLPQAINLDRHPLENIKVFRQEFQIYCRIAGIESMNSEDKMSVFHMSIGRDTCSVIDNLLILSEEEKKDVESVLRALEKFYHYQPLNYIRRER